MKTTITLTAITFLCSFLLAQSDQENLEKYWKYRDRYKQTYTKIGAERGGSIPINLIVRADTSKFKMENYSVNSNVVKLTTDFFHTLTK